MTDMPTDLAPAAVTLPDGRECTLARVIADDHRVIVFTQNPDGTVTRVLDRPVLAIPVPHDRLAPLRRQRVEITTTLGALTATRDRAVCTCRIRALRQIDPVKVLAEK